MKKVYIIPNTELELVEVSNSFLTLGSNSVKDYKEGGTITLGDSDDDNYPSSSVNQSLWDDEE